jgi:hypothetical protein
VASKGVKNGRFASVAMIGVTRRFFGSVARKGVRGQEKRGKGERKNARSARLYGGKHEED